jgi:prepilin-type N-terminal cleavage/methylation domain-containing protein
MRRGFTLIEVVITIVIWAILIIPIAYMVKEHIIGTARAGDIARAYNLARLEMAKVNNLSYSDGTLADGYNNTTTDYEGCGYDLNRAVSYANPPANTLKKVTVIVYESGTTNQLANLVTYVANVSVGAGSGGAAAGGGGQADYLVVSSGNVSAKKLHQLTLQNTSATDTITISQVTVSWTSASPSKPASLTTITLDGVVRWSGTQPTSGSTITLTSSFTLSAGTTYAHPGHSNEFEFSQNISSATLIFIMSDGSSTASYSW